MFSFNFGSCEPNDCLSSDEEVESAEEIKVSNDGFRCSVTQSDSITFKGGIEMKILSKENVLSSLKNDADSSIQEAENSHSDILPGIYEGGLKIWECTFDLGEYLTDGKNEVLFVDKIVLDLGCGAGILGILAKKMGARVVDFQDYNSGVLKHLTIPNVEMNFSDTSSIRFWSGDWGGFKQKASYDIILTSETIYNPKSYRKLHRLFKENLKPDGTIFLAAKMYYFGVGGSVSAFCEFIEKNSVFSYRKVFTFEEGVKRAIIEICFKK